MDSGNRANYEVTYDKIRHDQETKRFQEQHREHLPGAPIPCGNLRQTICYVDSPLPAASYTITLYMEKEKADPKNGANGDATLREDAPAAVANATTAEGDATASPVDTPAAQH